MCTPPITTSVAFPCSLGWLRRTLSSTRFVETTFVPFQPSNTPVPLMTLKTEYFTETSFGPFQPWSIPVPLTILRVLHRHILCPTLTIFAYQFPRRHRRMSPQRRNLTSSGYLAYPMWIKRSCTSSKHPFNN